MYFWFNLCVYIRTAYIYISWKKSYDKWRQHIGKQRHYFANKGPYSQSYGFSINCVWMLVFQQTEENS